MCERCRCAHDKCTHWGRNCRGEVKDGQCRKVPAAIFNGIGYSYASNLAPSERPWVEAVIHSIEDCPAANDLIFMDTDALAKNIRKVWKHTVAGQLTFVSFDPPSAAPTVFYYNRRTLFEFDPRGFPNLSTTPTARLIDENVRPPDGEPMPSSGTKPVARRVTRQSVGHSAGPASSSKASKSKPTPRPVFQSSASASGSKRLRDIRVSASPAPSRKRARVETPEVDDKLGESVPASAPVRVTRSSSRPSNAPRASSTTLGSRVDADQSGIFADAQYPTAAEASEAGDVPEFEPDNLLRRVGPHREFGLYLDELRSAWATSVVREMLVKRAQRELAEREERLTLRTFGLFHNDYVNTFNPDRTRSIMRAITDESPDSLEPLYPEIREWPPVPLLPAEPEESEAESSRAEDDPAPVKAETAPAIEEAAAVESTGREAAAEEGSTANEAQADKAV